MLSLAQDLARTLDQVRRVLAGAAFPPSAALESAAQALDAFVQRRPADLGSEGFPLPDARHGVMASYELHRGPGDGLTLVLNAIRAGASSAVHDHATWALIVAVQGRELNRLYERSGDGEGADTMRLRSLGEAVVEPGCPLVLPTGRFHSIHVPADAPTWQLHLYGQALEAQQGRRAVDLETGRAVILAGG